MLIAVFSDIHANLEALRAALAIAEARGADHLVSLGDVVGYGPSASVCVDIVRSEFSLSVLGNHDEAVVTGDSSGLPRDGQAAARLHREQLSEEQRGWLAGLPLTAERFGATFAHAAPDEPGAWPRLESFRDTQRQFGAFDTPICFVGHSHKPAVVSSSLGVFRVREGHRFLVNVGSVGQPRDHDPRLSFGLYDPDAFTVETIRAHYDQARTATRITEAGLPASLAERLNKGV
ncbi:metallophosphoesterase family protein [Rubrivirga sp. IMCC43871]|uniref:metallophosphoesterase family protein n=1 Tax=Rubrivirga sp. IMCC43871 TaxID=3391575 RepID=UPI003990172D